MNILDIELSKRIRLARVPDSRFTANAKHMHPTDGSPYALPTPTLALMTCFS